MFNEILTRAGYEVTSADSAFGTAALVRQLQPAAVLLDLGLPFLPGTSLLDELKGDPETADVPILVVSGLTEVLSAERRAMVADVLSKPIDAASLLDAIGKVLAVG